MSKQGRFCLFFEEEEHVSAYAWNKVPLSPSPVCAFPHEWQFNIEAKLAFISNCCPPICVFTTIKHASKSRKRSFKVNCKLRPRQLCFPGRRMLSWYFSLIVRLCILALLIINLILFEILFPLINYTASETIRNIILISSALLYKLNHKNKYSNTIIRRNLILLQRKTVFMTLITFVTNIIDLPCDFSVSRNAITTKSANTSIDYIIESFNREAAVKRCCIMRKGVPSISRSWRCIVTIYNTLRSPRASELEKPPAHAVFRCIVIS